MRGQLVKWDAAALEAQMPAWKRRIRAFGKRWGRNWLEPVPNPLDNPTANPACVEVIDLEPGEPPAIRYRRTETCL